MRLLVDGLHFGEGPRWHDGRLYLSDFYDHAVKAVTMDGEVTTVVEVPTQPSGLGWLPDGRMLVVSMVDRKVLRLEPDGLVEHADLSGIATFHCNDMVVDAHGRAYVGNFGFDLDGFVAEHGLRAALGEPGPPRATLARVDPDGTRARGGVGLRFPNGAVITPDGSTMIVAETMGRRLTRVRRRRRRLALEPAGVGVVRPPAARRHLPRRRGPGVGGQPGRGRVRPRRRP